MATKKKELLEQDAPVTETVMSEGETLPADTAQPESLPADAGDGLDLNELLGQMDQPQEDTSAEDMAEDPLPELTEEEMFGDTPAETDDQSTAPTDMPEDSDVQPPDVYENNADAVQEAPTPPKPKRTSRKKKEAVAPEETVTEEVPAETTESADTSETISVALFSYRGSLPEVLFLICADAHRTGRSRLGNAAIAWLCLFQPFAFPADGFFL